MAGKITRRSALGGAATAGVLAATGIPLGETGARAEDAPLKGRLKQSVCKWCYPNLTLDQLCAAAKSMGLQSVELLGENDWATVKKYGLTCAMANGPSGIVEGWNRPEDHDKLVKESERLLPLVKAAGLPNMIVFSGNRRGLADPEGLENCAKGLKRIMPLAEQLGVTVAMELLNSKRNRERGWNVNFERFLRREVLGKIEVSLVWGLDEADRLFHYRFGTEVFGLFRSWHNERSLNPGARGGD